MGRQNSARRANLLSLQGHGHTSSFSKLSSIPPRATLPSKRREFSQRSVENRRLGIAAGLVLLLLMGEAALFVHGVKTVPDFLSLFVAVP